MLRFCGHPFVDIGVATITAFAQKENPEDLALEDLERMANYLEEIYLHPALVSFLSIIFTMNAGYTQPGFSKSPEKRKLYATKVLKAFLPAFPRLEERDMFLGLPVAAISFDADEEGKLPPGRTYRQHIPLTTGEAVINFFPYGEAGLPVSGETLLAIQAFPLGCLKISGKLLAVHSDNPEITLYFARHFCEENRNGIDLAMQSGQKFTLEVPRIPRTLLVEKLLEATKIRSDARQIEQPFSVTAYYFSNSGQGSSLEIFHLPNQTVSFLQEMHSAEYAYQWSQIVQRAWQLAPKKKKGESPSDYVPAKNYLYEDLFNLPDNAAFFIRNYFLRIPFPSRDPADPRRGYSLRHEADIVSWKITHQFLRRILHMDKDRIEQIRHLADALAEYVSSENDTRFFREFFTQNRYEYFRLLLLKANLGQVKRGKPPILQFDSYLQVFEEGEELPTTDWRLARDLVLIRMTERLYQLGWFKEHESALPEIPVESENL
jgi:CRISPR-associated protein Cst1